MIAGVQKSNRRGREQAALRTELSAAARLELVRQVQAVLQEGLSLHKAKSKVARQANLSLQAVTSSWKKQEAFQAFLQEQDRGLDSLRKRGSWKALRKLKSLAQGARLPGKRGYLGTTDHQRSIWQAVAQWAQAEEANGWPLTRQDLLTDFQRRLEQAIAAMEAKQQSRAHSRGNEAARELEAER